MAHRRAILSSIVLGLLACERSATLAKDEKPPLVETRVLHAEERLTVPQAEALIRVGYARAIKQKSGHYWCLFRSVSDPTYPSASYRWDSATDSFVFATKSKGLYCRTDEEFRHDARALVYGFRHAIGPTDPPPSRLPPREPPDRVLSAETADALTKSAKAWVILNGKSQNWLLLRPIDDPICPTAVYLFNNVGTFDLVVLAPLSDTTREEFLANGFTLSDIFREFAPDRGPH